MQSIYTLRNDICEVGRRIFQRGYVAANDGNVSARIDDERVLVTPTGVSKGFMKPEDLAVVDMDGKVLSGPKKPSSEVHMHLRMYKERPDINSVCHAHPVHATAFAVAGLPLDQCVLPEVVVALGSIPLVEYGTPGTNEFFEPVVKYLKDYDAFLLANHGALTIGSDVYNAYFKMETLEHYAHITAVAQQLGHVNVLNQDQVQKLKDLRAKFGVRTDVGCVSCEDEGSCEIHTPEQKKASAAPAVDDKEKLVREVTEEVLRQLRG